MSEETKQMGSYISKLTYDNLPKDVVTEAKMRLADFIGISLASSSTGLAGQLRDYIRTIAAPGCATVYGMRETISPAYAAMVNAAMVFHLEMDDVHRTSHMHPGICSIPIALSLGQALGAPGKEVLTAFVAGYDACIRIGEAVSPSVFLDSVLLPTGVIGTIGAAATASSLLRLNEDQCAGALSSASYLTPLSIYDNYRKGPSIKELLMGWCNFSGYMCADLARSGLMGDLSAIEGEFGFCKAVSKSYDLRKITDGLGSDFKILSSGTKPYACCRQIHSVIDAVLSIREQYSVTAEDIRSIRVKTFRVAARAVNREFPTVASAKYSIPYAIAVAIIDGKVWREQFAEERLHDPMLLELCSKVDVVVDEELEKLYDQKWPAVVQIVTKDGRYLEARFDIMKGEPEYPVTESELQRKFMSLAGDAKSSAEAEAIWESILHFEELDSVGDFITTYLSNDG